MIIEEAYQMFMIVCRKLPLTVRPAVGWKLPNLRAKVDHYWCHNQKLSSYHQIFVWFKHYLGVTVKDDRLTPKVRYCTKEGQEGEISGINRLFELN